MKKNRIWTIVTIILLITAATLYFTDRYTTLKKESGHFAVEDTASITRIFIADKNNNEVTLVRSAEGAWLVDGKNPAQTAKVNSFLKTLADLEVRSPVPLAARDNVLKRMSVLAKKIEIYQVVPAIDLFNAVKLFPKERMVKSYYVGDVTQDNLGTFMLMEGADDPYVIHIPGFRGFVSTRYTTNPDEWRDYTVFSSKLGDIASVKLEFPGDPDESYLLDVGEDKSVRISSLDGQPLGMPFDTLRVLNLLTSFSDVRFEALLNNMLEKEFIDSVLSTTPSTIIELSERDGSSQRVVMYTKPSFAALYMQDGAALEPFDLDRAYALVNGGQDFVLIQYFVFDKVTSKLSYLLGID